MASTTDRHATAVARRLHHDRDLQRRFRRAPHRTLTEAGLGPAQVRAVLSGSARDLAEAGIDPKRVRRAPLRHRLRARVLTVVSTVLALLGGTLSAAPASAAGARFAQFGRRYIRVDARRIGRQEARYGLRFARTTVRQARFLLPGNGNCGKGCLGVEILD